MAEELSIPIVAVIPASGPSESQPIASSLNLPTPATPAVEAPLEKNVEELDFDNYANAELVRLQTELEKKNSFFDLENHLFTSYLNRVSPNALRGEEENDEKQTAGNGTGAGGAAARQSEKEGRLKKKRGEKVKEQNKPVMLTPEQKSEIATRELEELRDEIERQKGEWEKVMDNLKAEMEEIEVRNAEIKKATYEFRRDIVQQAVNPRTNKVIAERVVRYFEDKTRSKDATIEKVRLKNATLKVQKNKLQLQLKQKEEMGEVLHGIDFDQLKIENHQYMTKIEERNNELLKLKMTAGNTVQILNYYKKRLPLLTSEAERLKSEITARKNLLIKLNEESVTAEAERVKAARANTALKEQMAEFRVPSVMDYVEQKAKREEAARKLQSWERKVEISAMAVQRLRNLSKQMAQQTPATSIPHHLRPLGLFAKPTSNDINLDQNIGPPPIKSPLHLAQHGF